MQLKNSNPLVSISCLTFNHFFYIKECLDGFLMQKTTFPIEVILHDDCSTDGTREIIEEYSRKYPDIIFPMFQTENQYSKGIRGIMARFNFPRCSGKYIALCEGDDYWTDPYKLQKQVDFLDKNEEYVLCFHKVGILKTDGIITEDFITKVPENYETINTLAKLGNYIHTPSVVFRNKFLKLPEEFTLAPFGDYFIYMILAQFGKLKYIEDKMAVYRIGVGVWSTKDDFFRNFNTAYAHALLTISFHKKEEISTIFLQRIICFIDKYKSQLTPDHLDQLAVSSRVRKEIDAFFIKRINTLKKDRVQRKSLVVLFVIIMKRIKNIFFRNFKMIKI